MRALIPAPSDPGVVTLRFTARGAAVAYMRSRAPEIVLVGPAGTGKSRACLEKLHLQALNYPGMRGLICRKTLASLSATGLVTFREKVLHDAEGVRWFGGSKLEPAHFRYPNGSRLVVGGLDNSRKIMSSEYDSIFVQEAIDLSEGEWDDLTTRLRNGVMPYQQLGADTNPDRPTHWLKRRGDAGRTLLLNSRHEDNPAVTAEYLATLDRLTGVRRERLRFGRWAAAEGLVYDEYDARTHLIDRFPIPADWPRYLAVDFGYRNPFVCQWWARDDDGRLFRYREIYRTGALVEDHAKAIAALSAGEPAPTAVVCDHDAEDRATLERHLGARTKGANKEIRAGIQAVKARLGVQPDGKPRLFLLRDSVVARDPSRDAAARPASTEEEIDGYVWDTATTGRTGEVPVKDDDHGMDALRYIVMHLQGGKKWGVGA